MPCLAGGWCNLVSKAKDFNFVPYEILKQQRSKNKINLIVLVSILIVVLAFSLLLIPYTELKNLEAKKVFFETSIQSTAKIDDIVKLISIKQVLLAVKEDVLEQIEQNESDLILVLEELEKALPEDTYIQAISFSEKGIKLSGVARSDVVLANFIRSLKHTGLFEEVYVPGYSGGSDGLEDNVTFTVDCMIKSVDD